MRGEREPSGGSGSVSWSGGVERGVDDERGQCIRILCVLALVGAGSVKGLAEEGVVDLTGPPEVRRGVDQSLVLRSCEELEGSGVDPLPDGRSGAGVGRRVAEGEPRLGNRAASRPPRWHGAASGVTVRRRLGTLLEQAPFEAAEELDAPAHAGKVVAECPGELTRPGRAEVAEVVGRELRG